MKRRQIVKQNQTKKNPPKIMSVSGAKNEPQKLASCIFFPSNAYGSRQVVYQAGKPVAFLQSPN